MIGDSCQRYWDLDCLTVVRMTSEHFLSKTCRGSSEVLKYSPASGYVKRKKLRIQRFLWLSFRKLSYEFDSCQLSLIKLHPWVVKMIGKVMNDLGDGYYVWMTDDVISKCDRWQPLSIFTLSRHWNTQFDMIGALWTSQTNLLSTISETEAKNYILTHKNFSKATLISLL